MNEILEYSNSELTEDVALPIATLLCRSFLTSELTVEQRVEKILATEDADNSEPGCGRRFVIWDGRKAIAHAATFIRIARVGPQEIPVLALAAVCTDPDIRSRGLGAKITCKAFEQIGQTGLPAVSLFQTPVAEFYKKLDCRILTNRFVNRRNAEDPEANPWRDDTVMIYPSQFEWPDGIVDLNGPDY